MSYVLLEDTGTPRTNYVIMHKPSGKCMLLEEDTVTLEKELQFWNSSEGWNKYFFASIYRLLRYYSDSSDPVKLTSNVGTFESFEKAYSVAMMHKMIN